VHILRYLVAGTPLWLLKCSVVLVLLAANLSIFRSMYNKCKPLSHLPLIFLVGDVTKLTCRSSKVSRPECI
jgi:hypothetical protein